MMKTFLKVALLSCVLFAAACAPVYVPNVVNAPLLSESGEANIAGHMGSSGFDFQSSFALTSNIALMANGSFFKDEDEETYEYSEHFFGEAGIGYFKHLGKSGRMELFGGYGYGHTKAEDDWYFLGNQSEYAEAFFHRIFIQTNVGITTEYFNGGFAVRGCCLLFNKYIHNNNTYNEKDAYFFIEPVLFWGLGWHRVKMLSQVGISVCFNREPIGYIPFLVSFGININLGRNREEPY